MRGKVAREPGAKEQDCVNNRAATKQQNKTIKINK
jgi:hypothetical protein